MSDEDDLRGMLGGEGGGEGAFGLDELPTPPVRDIQPVEWQVDSLLAELVEMANGSDRLSFLVTLAVPGGVITGRLVGVATFYSEFGRYWEDALAGDELGSSIRETYVARGQSLAELARTSPPELPSFIQLVEARYVTGVGLVPAEGAGLVWRGRLAEVSGFSIGSLSPARRER
jgi:hypothetical protein